MYTPGCIPGQTDATSTPALPRLQLYDASTTPATKLGDPVVLNVTGGTGTDADPYVAGLGPFSQARLIAVAIQATGGAGGVATTLSQPSSAEVVGECGQGAGCWQGWAHGACATGGRVARAAPHATAVGRSGCTAGAPCSNTTHPCSAGTPAKPLISQAAGSNGNTATISISKAFTATKYTITLEDVNTPTSKASQTFTPADSETGPWTRTLTAPAKGTYRFKVRRC